MILWYRAMLSRIHTSALNRHTSEKAVKHLIQCWTKKFDENQVPEAESSIKHIICSILGLRNVSRLDTMRNQILTDDEYHRLLVNTELRLKRMPVQYVIGEWDFCGLTMKMSHSPSVFIPRPETEDLVTIASELVQHLTPEEGSLRDPSCFEIGCGSGAISLALLSKHDKLRCTAIDANPAAVSLSRLNSELLGLADRASFSIAKLEDDGVIHVFSPADSQKFDILVSNPPYIPTAEISGLQPEVFRYEDHLALDGGPDGTRLIETIIRNSPKWLRGGAFIVLEIDPRQTKMIQLISQDCGSYAGFSVRKDCFGVDRFVVLRCK
ncbi:MTRF1L release factor glutamine methyltransferase-like isoform X1 [Daphnia carinata]|uniref:MTRF1L release factor glutamine methyltransferase-like isoform X1 n=1 Tax=Daphnia carinata TaxID=120202 RepID=UPI00257D6C0F|nr:MTRF1L release factor glutamine methyltransferase-like isoform X1 [Daphnia carinata]